MRWSLGTESMRRKILAEAKMLEKGWKKRKIRLTDQAAFIRAEAGNCQIIWIGRREMQARRM